MRIMIVHNRYREFGGEDAVVDSEAEMLRLAGHDVRVLLWSNDDIAREVIQHLTGLVGAEIEVRLEISAEVPEGVPDDVVRTVTENARTLKFETHGFEKE